MYLWEANQVRFVIGKRVFDVGTVGVIKARQPKTRFLASKTEMLAGSVGKSDSENFNAYTQRLVSQG